jgi:hypothetical protein
MGAIVRHCVGSSLAIVKSFSSSSRDHSVFLILRKVSLRNFATVGFTYEGSSHSFHRALHCFAVFFASREAQRAHWLRPYFEMAALSTSSSTLDHCPTLVTTIAMVSGKIGYATVNERMPRKNVCGGRARVGLGACSRCQSRNRSSFGRIHLRNF